MNGRDKMSVKITYYDDVVIVAAKGNLMGGKETTDYQQMIKELIEGGYKKFVADLSKVKWMNSKGLGMLMACYTSCKNVGGNLKIAGATEKAQSLFMMTKLITIFESYDSVDYAVAKFKKEG